MELDHNHSHFVFVEDEDDGTFGADDGTFGAVNTLRGELEKCLCAAVAEPKRTLAALRDPKNPKKSSLGGRWLSQPEEPKEEQHQVPRVSICGIKPCT
jgi:hypothetical protein